MFPVVDSNSVHETGLRWVRYAEQELLTIIPKRSNCFRQISKRYHDSKTGLLFIDTNDRKGKNYYILTPDL